MDVGFHLWTSPSGAPPLYLPNAMQEKNDLWKALSVCSDALIEKFYQQFQLQVKDGLKGIVWVGLGCQEGSWAFSGGLRSREQTHLAKHFRAGESTASSHL